MGQAPHICLLMSGRPSLYRSALQLLSKQLRPQGLEKISLFALFWEPLSQANAEELERTFDQVQLWSANAYDFSAISFARKPEETNSGNFLSMQAGRQLLLEQLMASDQFDSQRYDIFCYTRPDVCLNDQLSSDFLSSIAGETVYVPKNGHWRNGVNDQFAMGQFSAIKTYLSLYSQIATYYAADRVPLHPELMLRHHLKAHQIAVNKLTCDNVIFRSEYKFAIG
jgi:hypothetical protein